MKFLFLAIAVIFCWACSPSQPSDQAAEAPEQPNILFIAVDDLRPEINSFGVAGIKTPNLDKLAATGLIFTRAYCNIPVCGASRASLLTGTRPTRNNFLGYDTWADKDLPDNLTLPEYFRQNGYHTISNGKIFHHGGDGEGSWTEKVWHPSHEDTLNNWRDYRSPENIALSLQNEGRGPAWEKSEVADEDYYDGKTARKTIDDLRRLKKEGKPFFLAAGFLKPHLPFNAPSKYWDYYNPAEIGLAPNPERNENVPEAAYHNFGELRGYTNIPRKGPLPDSLALKTRHGYYAATSYVDAQIGKVLDELEALDLYDNTIVILWGDHGWNLGEHGLWCKHCNFNTSLNAPIMLRVPWKQGGQKTQALTEFVDIYPTLCELANLPLPSHLDGKSFTPLLDDPDQSIKNEVISKYFNGVSIRTNQYLYTEWLDQQGNVYARMLFDHDKDPQENVNLAEDEAYQEMVIKLSQQMRDNWGKNFFDTLEVKSTALLSK